MSGYTKLFGTIIHSTIWQETLPVKVVWITMLAMKDMDGVVRSSVPGLAAAAGVSVDECQASLEKFMRPDKYSSSTEHEGRRINVVDGGWFILNHHKYQDMLSLDDRKAYWALKQRESRARKNALGRKIRKREREVMDRVGV